MRQYYSRSLHEVPYLCSFDSRDKGINNTDECHVYHTLREGNQCADFMTKLGVSSNIEFLLHASPPDDWNSLSLMRLELSFLEFSCCFFSCPFLFVLISLVTHKSKKYKKYC